MKGECEEERCVREREECKQDEAKTSQGHSPGADDQARGTFVILPAGQAPLLSESIPVAKRVA
jgi:hypothetical protein